MPPSMTIGHSYSPASFFFMCREGVTAWKVVSSSKQNDEMGAVYTKGGISGKYWGI